MLKGIDPLLNADVLHALRSMGHGDDLILADANFPAGSLATKTVLGRPLRIDRPVHEVARAVLSVLPLDSFADDAVARMQYADEPETVLPVARDVLDEVAATGWQAPAVVLDRFAFYERASRAFAVIQTGERRFYGCFALRKGVLPPDAS